MVIINGRSGTDAGGLLKGDDKHEAEDDQGKDTREHEPGVCVGQHFIRYDIR